MIATGSQSDFTDSETYGLSSQLQRAAVSVPANIAEGRQRKHRKEFLNFISIAYGSLAELETHMMIAGRLGYIDESMPESLLNRSAEIGRMPNGLRKSLQKRG